MNSLDAVASTTATTQSANINMQDFLKILLTQLTYQDPLKPMDNKEFMAQLAQFTTLGQTQELNTKVDALLATQASMQALGLIGRSVEVTTDGLSQTGTVSSLSWSGDSPRVSVTTAGGTVLPDLTLSQISLVR